MSSRVAFCANRRARRVRPLLARATMPDFASLRSGNEAYVVDEVFSVRLSEQGTEEGALALSIVSRPLP